MTPEEAARFVEGQREQIERMCALVARRNAFTPDRAALFSAWIDHTFSDNEYEFFRHRHLGEARPGTLMAVFIVMLSRRFLRPIEPALGDRFT